MAAFKTILFCVVMIGATGFASAQNRYIVRFKDKTSSPYSISQPEKFLSARAIARRIKQEIPVVEADLPVNPSYIQQLGTAGAKVYYTSRWLNCVLVQTTPAIASSLSVLPFVANVEYVAPGQRLQSGRTTWSKGKNQAGVAAATRAQLEMVGIDDMQGDNIYGKGIHIAFLDAGFDGVDTAAPFQHLFQDNKIVHVHDFVQNTKDIYRYDEHGTEVFSVIAANSDTYTGGAYAASFYLYVTEDVPTEYRVEEYNWLFAAERADSAGVDIISSSLGYNTFDDKSMDYNKNTDLTGTKAIISQAAIFALERGIVVICSAGNEGNNSWGTVTPPADVDGIVAVGSVTSSGSRSNFSSRGPTSDNRVKPDVVAMGSGVSVIRPNGTNGYASGTSLAAPIITSLIAGLLERFPDIDPNVIAQQVVMTASQYDHPDNLLGYGVPNYYAVKTALEGMLPLEEISVYPNPTDTGKFLVRFKTIDVQATITVYDLQGKTLSTHVVDVKKNNNPLEIDVANLPASSYLVKVKTSDNFKTFRLVKL
ncbi:MAG TPA: S8 family peptidase [Cyclobacteriaceae bacterium]|nr:S8 family peptidase [Cyclobacteriaceae bacterium]